MEHQQEDADVEALEQPSVATRLISDIKDYQITHSNLLKRVFYETPTSVPAAGVNVSCKPTAFPRRLYDEAVALQHLMNEMYVRAAEKEEWLYSVLRPQIESEPQGMMASLWDVHVKCREAGVIQDVSCGILRSDYMFHAPGDAKPSLKQVEMNTTAIAGACHSERVAGMHQYLLARDLAERVRWASTIVHTLV
jgi:glutathione synthase